MLEGATGASLAAIAGFRLNASKDGGPWGSGRIADTDDLMATHKGKACAMLCVVAMVVLSACSPMPVTQGIVDPHEATNRQTHQFNRNLDSALVRPASNAYGGAIPEPVRNGVGNFTANLSLPSIILNDLFQVRIGDAMTNTVRFAVNTTIGLGGLIDVAGAGGIHAVPTDFGETLEHFGVGEGSYHELPVIGPSTDRHTVGRIVDLLINPVNWILPANRQVYALGLSALSALGDRYRYSGLVDSLLYESEDSYAQARELYLQTRRFRVTGELSDDVYDDPYAN